MAGFRALSAFFARHPLLRDALIWSLPALLFGAWLRLLLLHYSPYAYWGSDSRSFFGFTNGVMTDFYFSLNEKRRYLYPIFLLPITLLPGPALVALAWIQAVMGLATVVVFGYIVRRVFFAWKWVIVPLTLLLAGLPIFIWHEHELIGDTFLFNGLVWTVAGWAAWTSQRDPARARRLWWVFFAAFAFIVLSKPSVKFFWPGLVLALAFAGAWRTLRWRHWAALGALFLAGLTVGDDEQGAWLIYNSAFPLTRLDTPAHAEIKAELRDWILAKRARLNAYAGEDYEVQKYLRGPEKDASRPRLQALAQDRAALSRTYRDLAVEAFSSDPLGWLTIASHRFLGSCNPSDLDPSRFRADYFARRLDESLANRRNPESMLRLAFGLGAQEPFPTREQFRAWINPRPDSWAAQWLPAYADAYQQAGTLVRRPASALSPLSDFRLTPLGWWVLVGLIMSLFAPFRVPLGVWVFAVFAGIFGAYLVGIQQVRYFAPAWPLVILALAIPLDAVARWWARPVKP